MIRAVVAAGLLLSAIASAGAQTTSRVGDQKGNSQAAKIRIVPIDDGVVADEQKTIDLYISGRA